MQRLTLNGFKPEEDPCRRCAVRTLHNANAKLEKFLFELWATRSPEQACEILAAPDVLVTNQKDKDSQVSAACARKPSKSVCVWRCPDPVG